MASGPLILENITHGLVFILGKGNSNYEGILVGPSIAELVETLRNGQ